MNATVGDRSSIRLGRRVLTALLICASSHGQTPGVAFFETKIRPLFASKCLGCHGAARMAGLDLTSAAGFKKGAASGPLVSVSDPNESRLMRAIGYEGAIRMPPSGKLTDDEIAALREWIRIGSPWPAESPKPSPDSNCFHPREARREASAARSARRQANASPPCHL
jgi:hypothetical protein